MLCSVNGCVNSRRIRDPGLQPTHFYQFPNREKSPQRYAEWCRRTRRTNFTQGSKARVCSAHFSQQDFNKFDLLKLKLVSNDKHKAPRLVKGVLPSFYLTPNTDTGKELIPVASLPLCQEKGIHNIGTGIQQPQPFSTEGTNDLLQMDHPPILEMEKDHGKEISNPRNSRKPFATDGTVEEGSDLILMSCDCPTGVAVNPVSGNRSEEQRPPPPQRRRRRKQMIHPIPSLTVPNRPRRGRPPKKSLRVRIMKGCKSCKKRDSNETLPDVNEHINGHEVPERANSAEERQGETTTQNWIPGVSQSLEYFLATSGTSYVPQEGRGSVPKPLQNSGVTIGNQVACLPSNTKTEDANANKIPTETQQNMVIPQLTGGLVPLVMLNQQASLNAPMSNGLVLQPQSFVGFPFTNFQGFPTVAPMMPMSYYPGNFLGQSPGFIQYPSPFPITMPFTSNYTNSALPIAAPSTHTSTPNFQSSTGEVYCLSIQNGAVPAVTGSFATPTSTPQ